jgi:membrane associated rhomboid family serine protease
MRPAGWIALYIAAILLGALAFSHVAVAGRELDLPPPPWARPVAAVAGALTGFILTAVLHKTQAGRRPGD